MSDASVSDVSRKEARPRGNRSAPNTEVLAKRLGLRLVSADALTIRRIRRGKGWSYIGPDQRVIRERKTLQRLAGLAVPPAYKDVLYAEDGGAHLQAIGRDAAGRLQYRYHHEWEKVREMRKTRRLARLAEVLPRVHRSVGQHLAGGEMNREFACSAVIELVARSGIRPGSESYARLRGTRGAATLLKSNVSVYGETVTLSFRSKGGKVLDKEFAAPRLVAAIARLREIPGRRLFQYRADDGAMRHVRARDVNAFLRETAEARISLKDFRTLLASAGVLDTLARIEPAASERQRRKQVLEAIRLAAEDLANTPAICRKSYVQEAVLTAFEDGILERFADALKRRSPIRRAQALAQIIEQAQP